MPWGRRRWPPQGSFLKTGYGTALALPAYKQQQTVECSDAAANGAAAGTVRLRGRVMNFEELTPDQQAKARACSTPEELLALAKTEGYELSDEELDGIAGGKWGEYEDADCAYYCNGRGPL